MQPKSWTHTKHPQTMAAMQLSMNHFAIHHYYCQQKLSLSSHHCPPKFLTKCALTKQGQRFLTTIAVSPSSDSSTTQRLISKFVSSSPKSVALSTLYHLLSAATTQPHLSFLALPLYITITQETWFSWNSKLVASVIALLYKQGQNEEAEGLISETVSTMCSKERDLVSFYCSLMNSLAKLKSESGFSRTYDCLQEMLCLSSSTYVKKRAYESLIGGLCVMDRPHEAEKLLNEMRHLDMRPSLFEFRSIAEGYGRLGLFEEMLEIVAEMENGGFPLDTISSNMVFSSYGMHNALSHMVSWMNRVKGLGIGFNIRTFNSVLNSCPTIISMLQDLKTVPISLKELLAVLRSDEAILVKGLTGTAVLNEIITWSSLESKLDLHGMHLSTSYIIMLWWMEELHVKFTSGQYERPAEITVVCGVGKHSSVRGDSPIKAMIRELMLRAKSPLRIDRKNIGCFIAKGKAVENWLC